MPDDEIGELCGKTADACIKCVLNACSIHSINKRNCISHEIDHALYGLWHGKDNAYCYDGKGSFNQ